jgi:regulator of protease activity HflC (stomatin/prohibitin superfamily)
MILWTIFFLLILGYVVFRYFVIVFNNHVMLCHTLNYTYTRTLKPGFHILRPLEYSTFYRWSDDIQGTQVKLKNSFDLEPFQCVDAKNTLHSVQYHIEYTVTDPYKAVLTTKNALESVCKEFIRRVRGETCKYDEILKFEKEISEASLISDYGITIDKCYMK